MVSKKPFRTSTFLLICALLVLVFAVGSIVGIKFFAETSQFPALDVAVVDHPAERPALTVPPAVAVPVTPAASVEAPVSEDQQAAYHALPEVEQASLWQAFSKAQREIRPLTPGQKAQPRNEGVRFFAGNPGQQLTARFLDGAIRVESGRGGEWAGTLSLMGGAKVSPVVAGDRAEFHHPGGVTEWYVNQPEGIEHGFTLARRPEDAVAGEVRLDLKLEGLSARAVATEEALDFVDEATGESVLRYRKLLVWDATGRELPARLEAQGALVSILVADTGAAYPLTIDPVIVSQEIKLTALKEQRPDRFGSAVALSGDTALVGAGIAYTEGAISGAVYVFVRNGTDWSQQGKLLASDAASGDQFGVAVALSGDTALVGASGNDGAGENSGSAYVFVRSGTDWSQQAKLLASDGAANDQFGAAVALSGDTVLVGVALPYVGFPTSKSGSAYVFVRSGTTWAQQAKLVADDAAAGDQFGAAVALSGSTALIGARNDDDAGSNSGSAYVFVRSGTTWTQQAKLVASAVEAESGSEFGVAVALSGDTALVGAYLEGRAYVFVRSGTTWTQQARLAAGPFRSSDEFGKSVALVGDTALIGAPSTYGVRGSRSGSAYVFVRSGTDWSQQAKLEVPDGAYEEQFGFSVALSGSTALVGEFLSSSFGGESGDARVFVRSGSAWSQQARFVASDGKRGDHFGQSVAVSENTALVGAWEDDTLGTNSGSAYLFARDRFTEEWVAQGKLVASDGAARDYFGTSVALWDDTALVGARYADNAELDSGSAYVFTRISERWSEQEKLIASDGAADDLFGFSVALSGNTALVGAYLDDNGGADSGSAYVFVRDGTAWSQQDKLVANDAMELDYFGYSVALWGETALIGARYDDEGGVDSGSAYVFVRSGTAWSQQERLGAGDASARDQFGVSVALWGDTALIGASLASTTATRTGSAYIFERSGTAWSQQAKLAPDDAARDDRLGGAVALWGDTALIGVYRDDDAGSDSGSAYVFARSGTEWSQRTKFGADDGVAGDQFGISVAPVSYTHLTLPTIYSV